MAEVWNNVAQNLNRLNNITQEIARHEKLIGSGGDNDSLRSELKQLREEGQALVKSSKEMLVKPFERVDKAKHDKLQAQLTDLATSFEKVAKMSIRKEMEKRLSQVQPRSSSSSSQPQQQQQQLHQQLLELKAQSVDDMILEQNNQDLRALEKEMTELSEVFVDVLNITQESGQDLQKVHSNVESADSRVESGNTQLHQASKYACAYRKKMTILSIIVLAVIVLIIILAVELTKK